MQTIKTKQALDPTQDAAQLRQLKRAAVAHRKQLLNLGKDLQIRLHYGATMSVVELLTTLYMAWMRVDPTQPQWSERDRFVLSKGHAAPALYVTLSQCGFFPKSEFATFRRLHSILQGHPDRHKTPGVDCNSGSLGQGFPVACGMALGAKIDGAAFRTYVVMSDGECNEGSIWEAALIAANLKIDNVTVLLDWNKKSSYGVMKNRNDVEPLADKWRAFGWAVFACDGHDFVSLTQALAQAEQVQGQPAILLCHTIKGKGIPYAEANRTPSNFGLTDEHYQEAMAYLDAVEREI